MTAETATPLAIFDHWRDELTGGVALGDELDDLRSRLAESQSANPTAAELAARLMSIRRAVKALTTARDDYVASQHFGRVAACRMSIDELHAIAAALFSAPAESDVMSGESDLDRHLETYRQSGRSYVLAKGQMNGRRMTAFAWSYVLDEPPDDCQDEENWIPKEWEWRAEFYDQAGCIIRDAFVSYGFSLPTGETALDRFESWCKATGFALTKRFVEPTRPSAPASEPKLVHSEHCPAYLSPEMEARGMLPGDCMCGTTQRAPESASEPTPTPEDCEPKVVVTKTDVSILDVAKAVIADWAERLKPDLYRKEYCHGAMNALKNASDLIDKVAESVRSTAVDEPEPPKQPIVVDEKSVLEWFSKAAEFAKEAGPSPSADHQCPECGGRGELLGMFPVWAEHVPQERRKPTVTLTCSFCQGLGRVSRDALSLREQGARLRELRKERMLGLRSCAESLGVLPSEFSFCEQGLRSREEIFMMCELLTDKYPSPTPTTRTAPLTEEDIPYLSEKPLRPPASPSADVERLPDNSDADGTDAAHPAWRRGEEYGVLESCLAVNEILDGKADGEGIANEPWESTRRRLLALAARVAELEGQLREWLELSPEIKGGVREARELIQEKIARVAELERECERLKIQQRHHMAILKLQDDVVAQLNHKAKTWDRLLEWVQEFINEEDARGNIVSMRTLALVKRRMNELLAPPADAGEPGEKREDGR